MNPNMGKYRWWLTRQVLREAQPYLHNDFGLPFREYVKDYYQRNALTITYLDGGTWATGQSFRVVKGGCVIVVTVDGF